MVVHHVKVVAPLETLRLDLALRPIHLLSSFELYWLELWSRSCEEHRGAWDPQEDMRNLE